MKTINREEMVAALTQVVAERGDNFRYTPINEWGMCVYVHEGRTSCGVGAALHGMGVSLEDLEEMNGHGSIEDVMNLEVLQEAGLSLDSGALMVASLFQEAQDDRIPYFEALALAVTA